jgi:predicted transcriptional regulator
MDNKPKEIVRTTSKNITLRWKLVEGQKKVQNQHQELPKETGDLLRGLSTLAERRAYCRLLVDKGWTLQSIANELFVTREMVRLYTKHEDSDLFEIVSHLPVPDVPVITEQVYVRTWVEIDPQVLKRLKELQPLAQQVRSHSPRYRAEGEEYTRLIAGEIERGVLSWKIAEALGVTHGAINFRMTRYGYKPIGTGKTKAYQPIIASNRAKRFVEPNPTSLARLLELKELGLKKNFTTNPDVVQRDDEFNELLAKEVEAGVFSYDLAKAVGLSQQTIQNRLERAKKTKGA